RHDAEPIWMLLAGLERVVDAVAFPRRRHDDHAIDTGRVHHLQAFLIAERLGAVAVLLHALARAGDPRPVRRFVLPDVDLRVDEEHGLNSLCRWLTIHIGPPTLRQAGGAQLFGAGT